MQKSFTGQEYVKALIEGKLQEAINLIGMVKRAENDREIQFALGTQCEEWIPIPVDAIDKIERIKKVSCKDHEHDLVRLAVREEVGTHANFLARLLRIYIKNQNNLMSIIGRSRKGQDVRREDDSGGYQPCSPFYTNCELVGGYCDSTSHTWYSVYNCLDPIAGVVTCQNAMASC